MRTKGGSDVRFSGEPRRPALLTMGSLETVGDGETHPDARYFVRRDSHPHSRAANQQRPVRLSIRDLARRSDAYVRVRGLEIVGTFGHAAIDDRLHPRVLLEVRLDELLVLGAGVVAPNSDGPGRHDGYVDDVSVRTWMTESSNFLPG